MVGPALYSCCKGHSEVVEQTSAFSLDGAFELGLDIIPYPLDRLASPSAR